MQRGFAPILVLVGILVLGLTAAGVYYFSNQQASPNPSVDTDTPIASITPSSNPVGNSTNSPQPSIKKTSVKDPGQYGFTKLIELPVIGVKAKFYQGAEASLDSDNYYNIGLGPDLVAIFLNNYSGGGRRAWFQKNYGNFADTFEPFSTNEHSGYIAYLKNGIDKNSKGFFYYFTVASSGKMLLVQGYNSKEGGKYFGEDLDKFKSFLSTVELINITKSPNSELKTSDLNKWSDNRKIIWQDELLGLKITGPEWVDYRSTSGRNVDGSWNFGEWSRRHLSANTYQSSYFGKKVTNVSIQIGFGSPKFLDIFIEDYKNQDFNDVVYDLLFPAGFCATEWKQSKSQCESSDYCYTKDEVVQSLRLVKSQKIGSVDSQLRGVDDNFDYLMDCRSFDTWLIKAKNGSFVIGDIYPEGEILRLEGY